jgi:SAM-dependent methyltransferase
LNKPIGINQILLDLTRKKKDHKVAYERAALKLQELDVSIQKARDELVSCLKLQKTSVKEFVKGQPTNIQKIARFLVKEEQEKALGEILDGTAIREKSIIKAFNTSYNERIIELPTVVEALLRLDEEPSHILDVGNALNKKSIIRQIKDKKKRINFFTQSADKEEIHSFSDVASYNFGDAINLPFKDGLFSSITCVSTIEHVGFENKNYGIENDKTLSTNKRLVKAQAVIDEIHRCLKVGGNFLLTVPVSASAKTKIKITGKDGSDYSIFSISDVYDLLNSFTISNKSFFHATAKGWERSKSNTPKSEYEIFYCECIK